MRPLGDIDAVTRLLDQGLSGHEIARRMGMSPATVNRWRTRPPRRTRAGEPPSDWHPPDDRAYCYLLGLYLGDGCIWIGKRRWPLSLRIYLDACYPSIVAEARAAMAAVAPESTTHQHIRTGCVALTAGSAIWPVAFPQAGPGHKHERIIELADWQCELTERHPKALLRGLVHSDGCRCVNRFTIRLPKGGDREYAYVRYFSSNRSLGIPS
jgi:hypothetical protein